MTTTESIPELDVWSWTTERSPSLASLLALKAHVLAHAPLWEQVRKRVGEIKSEEAEPRIAGLARWMLAQYHRAWPLLVKAHDDAAVTFARAECCLKAQVSEGGSHAQRRPDLAAGILKNHAERKTNTRVAATYFEALLYDQSVESARKAWDDTTPAFRASADGHFVTGRIAEDDGDYKTAQAEYEKAVGLDASHRGALLRLAYQHDIGGDDEVALEYYSRLAGLRPMDTHALVNYGVMLEDRGLYREAINCYRAILAVFPNHSRAASYLRDALGSLNMIFDEDSDRRHDKRAQILRVPIGDFELSVRARNCLAKMNIETLGDLVQKTEEELMAYKNFGDTSLDEIKKLLDTRGLRLGMNLDEDPIPEPPPDVEHSKSASVQVQLPPGVDPGVLNKVLADMELSVRCRKALAQIKAVTLGDLLAHSESELLTIKNFGQTSLNELKGRLSEFGVSLTG